MQIPLEYVQGTIEWLEFRQNKITATDASVIMGVNKWKTKLDLYYEKTSPVKYKAPNAYMQRGIDLEPLARELFTLKTDIQLEPVVVVSTKYPWMMASLDGGSPKGEVLEIKCCGAKDHSSALAGKVPKHYYPQLQHQMAVCEISEMYYFSFDGIDGEIVIVSRDDEYIEKMIEQEKIFYDCMINKILPT